MYTASYHHAYADSAPAQTAEAYYARPSSVLILGAIAVASIFILPIVRLLTFGTIA